MTQLAGSDALDYAGGPLGDGFDAFYAAWYPRLLRLATCIEPAWAEEIAQETLARAYAHFDRLHQEMPGPWLRTVARNVARDLARFDARVETLPEAYENEMTDPYPGPEDIVLVEDARALVRSALRDVSDVDREILAMSSVDGVTTADLAAHLRASEGAVRVRLHRARRRLGKSYLARGGNLALAPVFAMVRALNEAARKLARPIEAGAAPVAAAAAAMAGAAAVIVAGVLPTPGAAAHAATPHATAQAPAAAVTTSAARHAVAPSRSHAPVSAPTLRTTNPVALPSTSNRSQIVTHVDVPSTDPSTPGNKGDVWAAFLGPDGNQWTAGGDITRSPGPSVTCYYTGLTCSGGSGRGGR